MKKVKDIMSTNPVCCTRETRLEDVARMMVESDCGEIPVVESIHTMRPVGAVTDRDIVCRTIAEGRNPLDLTVEHCMSTPCVTVTVGTDVEECYRLMEQHRIRRIPVVDDSGACCGIVSQADVARCASEREAGEVVREISQPGTNRASI